MLYKRLFLSAGGLLQVFQHFIWLTEIEHCSIIDISLLLKIKKNLLLRIIIGRVRQYNSMQSDFDKMHVIKKKNILNLNHT